MQANYNKQRTPTTFDLPSADADFLAALQKFIEKDAERRSRIVRDSLSIRIDGVHQRVIDSESWCLLEFGGGTSKVEIVGRDGEGEVVIATYLPTYDGPKTEAWKVSLPWGDELSCTFEYDDDECVHVEAKRIVKPKLGEEPAQLTQVPQQGFFRFDRADPERLRLLVKESLITQDQLQKALEFQRANGGKLESCLTRMGFITDDDITGVLSRQYGVPTINLKDYEIDPNVIKLIPQDTASRYHLIPLSRVGSVLTIAMSDPTNVFAMDDIKFMTGLNVEPVVASEAAIGDAITRFYGGATSNTEELTNLMKDLAEEDQDARRRKFGVAREYGGALVHRTKDELRSLHASLSEPEDRQGHDEKSTQDRGEGPSHSSRDKI